MIKNNNYIRCILNFKNSTEDQGLYGSWKTWRVLEFCCGIFQDWKVLEKRLLVLESSGNLLNASKKNEMYGRQ